MGLLPIDLSSACGLGGLRMLLGLVTPPIWGGETLYKKKVAKHWQDVGTVGRTWSW